eukprot:5364846-Amphidinium_carterae.1
MKSSKWTGQTPQSYNPEAKDHERMKISQSAEKQPVVHIAPSSPFITLFVATTEHQCSVG